MQLYFVHPKQIDPRTGAPLLPGLWPHIEHYINDVCRRSREELTPESIRQSVEDEETQLWVIVDPKREGNEKFRAVLGTQLAHVMSGMKVCRIIFCAGRSRKEWLHLLDKLAEWARSEGCGKFRISARRGWVKDLHQFKIVANLMEMDLTHDRGNREDNAHEV